MADDLNISINVADANDGAKIAEELAAAIAKLRKELSALTKQQKSTDAKEAAAADKAARKQALDELRASAIQISVDRKKFLEEQKEYNRQQKQLLKEEAAARSEAEREKIRAVREAAAAERAARKQALAEQRAANKQAQDELKASSIQIRANRIAYQEAQKAANETRRAQTAAAKESARIQKESEAAARSHAEAIRALRNEIAAWAAAFIGFQGFRRIIDEGLEFNRTIETANLGIASLIAAQTRMTDTQGNLVEGIDKLRIAQVLAADQVVKLRVAGLQTVATTEQLVVAFQQAVAVGLRWGLTLDQIRTLTVQMSQAAGALGVPLNQLNEEIRSLLTGTITPRNTRIATALGITNKQIKEAQVAGNLFEFVTKRMEAFSVAGEATAKTFSGVMSNIKEALQNLTGDATKPLFDTLKTSGQAALEEIFDLKNARIAFKFAGILDLANDIFGSLGDMLSDALESGVKGAEDFSKWLTQSRVEVGQILSATGILNREITSLAKESLGMATALGQVGVESGFFSTVLLGAAAVVAEIHTAFQGILILLGFIGGVILTALVAPFVGWLRIVARVVSVFNQDMAQSIDNAATKGETFIANLGKGLKGYIDDLATGGNAMDNFTKRIEDMKNEAAAATLAHSRLRDTLRATVGREDTALLNLDQERKDKRITQADYVKKEADIKVQSVEEQIKAYQEYLKTLDIADKRERDRTVNMIEELKRRRTALLRSVNLESIDEKPEEDDNARARAIGLTKLIKQQEAERLRDLKILLENQKIAYKDYYDEVTKAQQESIDKQIVVQRELLGKTEDKGQREKILEEIKVLESQRVQLVEDNNEKLRQDLLKLEEEITKAHVNLLRGQGRLSEARALEISDRYKRLVAELSINGKQAGAAIVDNLFNIDNAKTRMEEISKLAGVVTNTLEQRLKDISIQTSTHSLTEKESRQAIVKAYREAHEQLTAMLPDMERSAKITKDPEALLAVAALKSRLAEMGVIIRRNADDFYDLKEAARSSATSALAGIISGASELPFSGNTAEIEALREHAAAAQRELDRLAAGPVSEETTDRMRELRFEIDGVNRQLKDAEDSIRGWRDLFVDAARSVVKALQDIAAQMLATLIIQNLLKSLGGPGAAVASTSSVTGTAARFGTSSFAAGGYVTGPGTSTSDSIPARLSAGEFVMKASAVRALGVEFLDALNNTGFTVNRSRLAGHYADGGLVQPTPFSGGSFEATLALEDGLVLKHLGSPEGHRVLVNFISKNKKTVRQLLGD